MQASKLQLFIKLAETGSFHRAAQQQHVSPSKLSRVIKNIEEELGVTLFYRDNRHVELTTQGKHFLSFAREQIKQWETFRDTLSEHTGKLTGTVSIYCSVTASYSFLYDILSRFRQAHPLIQIKVHTGDPADAIDRVTNGHEDIAIAAKPDTLPNVLSFKPFDTSPLIFIQASDEQNIEPILASNEKGNWSGIPMIVSEKGLARERFNEWVKAEGFKPTIYSQVSGNEAIVSMVSLGFGIGLIPTIVAENSPLKNRVKPFAYQPTIAPFEVGACVQSQRLKSPLVKALWELMQ